MSYLQKAEEFKKSIIKEEFYKLEQQGIDLDTLKPEDKIIKKILKIADIKTHNYIYLLTKRVENELQKL